MFGLKDKFGELKEDVGTIKNNINKLSVILENEKASVLELQKEIQNSYDLLMEKIDVSNEKEEETKLKQDELNNLREELRQVKKELVESDIENKTLTQNIKVFTQDNKNLQEKLYQKELDEFKLKIITSETNASIEELKNKMDEQNREMQKYKIEIENLKDEIEKQNKTNVTPISIDLDTDLDQEVVLNNNSEKIEEEFRENTIEKNKEQKKYVDLLKEGKLDTDNIQEFILNRSKLLEDPEKLSTNDWKKILNFGITYKILTNFEIQQVKQISLMLGNSGYKSERSEILNKVKENGFEISLYKVEDWEKVLEFLVETKGITKEVKEGFEGIFKKYKKKKMFKLEQLKFILPYFEKYKENIKAIEVKSNDDFLETEEESCLTNFGKSLVEKYKESFEVENTEKNVNLEENSNENIEKLNTKILAVESDEWYKIKQWLHENNILDCNHQKKVGYYNFCDTLNESKRFDNKLTTGQMIKAREIYTILEDARYFDSEHKVEKDDREEIDSTNEIKGDKNITDFIMDKLKKLEDMRIFTKEEWKNILDFGIQYDLFRPKGMLEARRVEGYKRNGGKWNGNLLEMGKRTYKVVEKNGYNASIFDFYEWNKVVNHLKDNKILTSNIVNQFYNISNESEETGFFSIEQLKFISPYLEEFKELVDKSREIESGKVVYEVSEEFKESKYDLSEKQDRVLRELKLFASKDWENLSIWSDNRLLIENEDLKLLNNLRDNDNLNSLKELELIGLIELYDYLVEEGFDKDSFNLEELKESEYDLSENQDKTLKELELFSSKEWEVLSLWGDKKSLIGTVDINLLNNLRDNDNLNSLNGFELRTLIELYDYLIEEGFNKDSLDLEEKTIENINNDVKEKVDFDSIINSDKNDMEEILKTTINLKKLKSFDPKQWRELYDWSDKKLLIQHEDHKLLAPLVNGNPIGEMKQSDLTNLLNLYNRLIEKGYEKYSDIQEEKEIEVLEEESPVNEDELLEEVRNFKSKDWIDMLDWAKKNKKLRTQDYNILSNLAFRSIDKELNDKELVLGLEIYFIAKSEGFKRVKEKDVDEFLMQFVDENIEEISIKNKKEEIPDVLKNILF